MTANVTLAVLSGVLCAAGVYLLTARGIIRAFIGVMILSNGINLLFLVASGQPGRAPIVGPDAPTDADMSDPLPQALVLTAIVITVALTAFVVALGYRNAQLTGSDVIIDDIEDTKVVERAAQEPGPDDTVESGIDFLHEDTDSEDDDQAVST